MSTVQDVAAQLRGATSCLPTGVVAQIDDELDAALALLSETLHTSSRYDEVMGSAMQLRAELAQQLTETINAAKKSIVDKANALAQNDVPAPASPAPASAPPAETSRKAEQLRGKPLPKTNNKNVNKTIRETPGSGWAVEKRSNSHIRFYGPNGETHTFSSTPGSKVNERKAAHLRQQIMAAKKARKNR